MYIYIADTVIEDVCCQTPSFLTDVLILLIKSTFPVA